MHTIKLKIFILGNPLLSLDANDPKTNRMHSMHAISISFQSVNLIKIKNDVINLHKINLLIH